MQADPARRSGRSSGSSGSRASSRATSARRSIPKLTAYIEKWNVDIGDKVKKGDVLATLFVPELVEDYGTKKATVELDEERIELAQKVVEVAEADVKAAEARLDEAKAILAKYQAEVDRWDIGGQAARRARSSGGVVDPQILLESTNQWKSSIAARDAAKATITKAEAELLSDEADARQGQGRRRGRPGRPGRGRERGEAARGLGRLPHAHRPLRRRDRGPQRQHLRLRPARHRRPHGHARAPPTSRPAAPPRRSTWSTAPTSSGSSSTSPSRTPTTSTIGTKATVLAWAYRDEPIPGTVTRTSWALNIKSRTLRAEIDLPNPGSQLLPGMYAYAKVIIERPDVRALPVAALTHSGDKTFCWTYEDGHAVRTEVQTGVSDGEWIEVTNRQLADGVRRRRIPGRRSTARNR